MKVHILPLVRERTKQRGLAEPDLKKVTFFSQDKTLVASCLSKGLKRPSPSTKAAKNKDKFNDFFCPKTDVFAEISIGTKNTVLSKWKIIALLEKIRP